MRGNRDNEQRKLEQLEQQLLGMLRKVLPQVAVNGDPIFHNSENNPHRLNPAHLSREGEELWQLAKACIAIHARLETSTGKSPSESFVAACRESGNLLDPHMRGPRRLAADLLDEWGGRT